MVPTGKRDYEGNVVWKPDCVLDYNKYMGAVDRCDQMVTYGSFQRKTLKWWKKVFFHTLGLAVLNAYHIYKHREDHPVPHRLFRRQLVAQLVEDSGVTGPEASGRRRAAPEVLQRLSARHFPCHLPPTGKKVHAQRRCIVCGPAEADIFRTQNPGVKVPNRTGHDTNFQCKQCKVALCITPCFELYHTVSDYTLAYRRHHHTAVRNLGQEE
ncbi:piggyBac transposable element-derived protein 4-like [Pecten maximus]|uniref:piggyBac transposable element-derived protein 4-like n=1 Tax=Pecten maximus TaxID=6579 RepID=UPI001458D426|nr:piggyBac transposable element-derived protein 4-like [Pecten maximus]